MKSDFDFPDMDDLAQQMEDAMGEAKKAMEDLPIQMGDVENVMGSLAGLMGGLPGQIEELSGAVEGFEEQHEANTESMIGKPDWSVTANIRIEEKLHILVDAVFDLVKIRDAWESTQGAGFESLVEGVVADAGVEADTETMGQILGQLKKGRSVSVVQDVKVLACRIQGAPKDAAETLQLSPEANIPLQMDQKSLGFEFAPLLTIRNKWERANIPTFSPMAEEIMVPLKHFEDSEPFNLKFEPSGQDFGIFVELNFQPIG